jgi:hypothetical protein
MVVAFLQPLGLPLGFPLWPFVNFAMSKEPDFALNFSETT